MMFYYKRYLLLLMKVIYKFIKFSFVFFSSKIEDPNADVTDAGKRVTDAIVKLICR
jgi:hypothetical protein